MLQLSKLYIVESQEAPRDIPEGNVSSIPLTLMRIILMLIYCP